MVLMWLCVSCSQVEVKLEGDGPWTLPDGSKDMEIVLTPGHTEFHCCLVYEPKKVIQKCHCHELGMQA